jgi:hypothetical protein
MNTTLSIILPLLLLPLSIIIYILYKIFTIKKNIFFKTKKTEYEKLIEEMNTRIDYEYKDKIELKETELYCIENKIQNQKNILSDLKNKSNIINEINKKNDNKENIQYNKIIISSSEKFDIEKLFKLHEELINKDIIPRLIWEIYYKKKYDELVKNVLNMKKISGIYKITNISNGKSYIGKSVDIGNRWKTHLKNSLGIECISTNNKFHKGLLNDGIENFNWEVLEICDKNSLSEKEKFWTLFFDTVNYGYNEKCGG